MNKEIEYFWETEYKFAEFLKSIFEEGTFERKYSLDGGGIYNLLYLNNKVYEIKYTSTKKMLDNNLGTFRDDKEYIINTIVKNLKTDKYSINSGKFITFHIGKFIAKVEVVKKLKIPT